MVANVVEWRKQYRKYKPLTTPKKCIECGQKTVKDAYHILCDPCADKKDVCAKCLNPSLELSQEKHALEMAQLQSNHIEEACKNLREREKRALLRKLNQVE